MKKKLRKFICGYNENGDKAQLIAHNESVHMVKMVLWRNGYKIKTISRFDNYRLIDTDIPYTEFTEDPIIF